MCEICRRNPCVSGCPNAPEPPVVFVCSGCGHSIYEGDTYMEVMYEQFCEECVYSYMKVAEYDPD